MMSCLCYIPEEPAFERVGGVPQWPPPHPPVFTKISGLKLIGGYLKRKSSKSDGEVKWALRWMEVEPPDDERPDFMLAVYKTDIKEKRLNAVSVHNISQVMVNDLDPTQFFVVVGPSSYTLMARDEYDAAKWVDSLNQVIQFTRGDKDGTSDGCAVM
mmetsp:Transcript_4794/g.19555  ORF Transcript_4794/g.19555 Transcript_4794/m.19555 type:complete len:157 (-) Transcript_4794:4155-4625(-)